MMKPLTQTARTTTSAPNTLRLPGLTERSRLRLICFPGPLVLVVIGLLHFSAASVSARTRLQCFYSQSVFSRNSTAARNRLRTVRLRPALRDLARKKVQASRMATQMAALPTQVTHALSPSLRARAPCEHPRNRGRVCARQHSMMSQLLMRRSAAAIASSLGDACSPPLARLAGAISQQLLHGPRSESCRSTAATACDTSSSRSSCVHTAALVMHPAVAAASLPLHPLPEAGMRLGLLPMQYSLSGTAGPSPDSGTAVPASRSPAAAAAACLAVLTGIWHIASPSCALAETQQKVRVPHPHSLHRPDACMAARYAAEAITSPRPHTATTTATNCSSEAPR